MAATPWEFSSVLLLAGLAGAGGARERNLPAKEPPAKEAALTETVDKLVTAWEPVARERRFDDIGWAADIRDAFRLAREHHRPVFLFTYSGSAEREHAMALQRC